MNNISSLSRVGILTYHSAYNFGSVLQAFATQEAIKSLGCEAEIINYRMRSQKDYYQKLYRTSFGFKPFIKDCIMFPVRDKRKKRAQAFETFINSKLRLTKEIEEPGKVMEFISNYPLVVSGSDQIWNFHSNELEGQPFDYIRPYLLDGYLGRKVSYASSVGNMSDAELDSIIDYIKLFDHVSFREISSNYKINERYGICAINVPDPTFLLSKIEWTELLELKELKNEKYVLYYSLRSYKPQRERSKQLKLIAEKTGLKVKIVTPFVYMPYSNDRLENHLEFGPIEFISAIMNAEIIITDSYHGTILSANFGKNFYSICENVGSEFRKTDILKMIGLESQIVGSIDEVLKKMEQPIDYVTVYEKIDNLRTIGYAYLKKVIG